MSDTQPTRRGFLRTLAATAVLSPLVARAEAAEAALDTALSSVGLRPDDPLSVRALRSHYLLDDGLTYLNHASIGTVPRPVHEAHVAYLELCERHPSLYVWGRPWREVTEATRAAVARLFSVRPDDLAITHNTTEGFNVLAHGLPLRAGDEVLFSSLNHPGASVPWVREAGRAGFTVRTFDFPVARAAELTTEEVVALHTAAIGNATRALVLPHVDNSIGLRHPLAELAAAARGRGVEYVVVDGAQSAGMIPVALESYGIDAYAMSPHKWIQAPKGLGLLWVPERLRDRLPAMWHRTPGARPDPTARRYEDYSTRAWPAVVALGDALAFQEAVGSEPKRARLERVRDRIRERVDAEAALEWRSPEPWSLGSAIVAVSVRGRPAPELGAELMERHRIDVRAFGPPLDALRLSPGMATTEEELDRVLEVLVEAAR